MSWRMTRRPRRLVAALLALGLFSLLACSSSTDPVPGPGDLSFTFDPPQSVVGIYPGNGQTFRVAASPTVQLGMSWSLNGDPVSTGESFPYSAQYVGVDTLRAVYSYQGSRWTHTWYVDVTQNPSTAPPAVPSIALAHGTEAVSVRVNWQWISNSEFPMAEYLVAMSFDGPINSSNWEEARLLGSVEHLPNLVGYSLTVHEDPDGLEAGRRAWFAVRGRDAAGQLSLIDGEYSIVISSPWMVQGYVYDDSLNPIPDVIVDYGCPSCRVNTDATGFYSFGPVPDVSTLTISTLSRDEPIPGQPNSAWYDYSWSGVTYAEDGNYDIILGSRYGLDEGCGVHDLDFMTYFRRVTWTDQPSDLRPNLRLYRWDEYPLSVYVQPGFINESGLDMSALTAEAVGFWNIAMGEEYFTLTTDPAAADVDVYFGFESVLYAGRAYVSAPDDEDYRNGDVIPQHMRVFLWEGITNPVRLQETAMHELGHVLGLHAHNLCEGGGFLMDVISAGMLDNGPENAVHPDEKRAVRMIRNLPQGLDMAGFE